MSVEDTECMLVHGFGNTASFIGCTMINWHVKSEWMIKSEYDVYRERDVILTRMTTSSQ